MSSFRFNFEGGDLEPMEVLRPAVVLQTVNRTTEKHQEVCRKVTEHSLRTPLWKESRDRIRTRLHSFQFEKSPLIGRSLLFCSSELCKEQLSAQNNEARIDLTADPTVIVSDLRKGVYEGGFKVWESTFDLLRYLDAGSLDLKDKRVLDLGCGAGLLGIFALICKAKFVCFQDYNHEVIEAFSIPNLFLNFDSEIADTLRDLDERRSTIKVQDLEKAERVAYLSGDWGNIEALFKDRQLMFDVVLSAETIYDTHNYEKIYELLSHCLSHAGVALFASKSYYFGVGGSTKEFVEFLESEGIFCCRQVWTVEEGVNREIIQVTKTPKL